MKSRITLINNLNHNHKTIFLANDGSDLLKIAKNKLKLPKACILYLKGGKGMDPSNIRLPLNNETIYVSCGEPYAGPKEVKSGIIKIIADKSFIDPQARDELSSVAKLPGVISVIGMPDLHAGPTGCVVLANKIYPHLAGNDIGCGIGLYKAGKSNSFNINSTLSRITTIKPYDIVKLKDIFERNNLLYTDDDNKTFGTIGHGNHFAEFMEIDSILNITLLESMDLKKDDLFLCVHSGSRNLGKKIFDRFVGNMVDDNMYLQQHDYAVKWALLNRYTIASRLLNNDSPETILDITHNSITKDYYSEKWIHRKGSAPTDRGPIIIPGSRGSYSYLVKPKEIDMSDNGWSLAHGAGRILTRSKAQAKITKRYGHNLDALRYTPIGSHVHCTDPRILAEEIPEAYKDIDVIIDDLSDYIDVIARLKPVLTIKDF